MPRLASASGVNFYLYSGSDGGEDGPTEYNDATMIFVQSTAPTGWTKNLDYDDYALRVVSGVPSFGGTVNFTSVFTTVPVSGTVASTPFSVGNTTLTTDQLPSHGHLHIGSSLNPGSVRIGPLSAIRGTANPPALQPVPSPAGPGTTPSSSGTHTHTQPSDFINTFTGNPLNMNVKYVDAILATYQV